MNEYDRDYGYGTPMPRFGDLRDLITTPFSVRFDRLLMRTIAKFAYLIQSLVILGALAGAAVLAFIGFKLGDLTAFGFTVPSILIGLVGLFVVAPVFFVTTIVISRVVLEFVVVFFRMNDDIREIREARDFTISLESAQLG